MYELSVQREFCAAHAIVMHGQREPTHGHNWCVTVVVRGEALDDDGLLCDFHRLERALDEVLAPMHNADLNRTPPFDRVNPTAEHLARHIAEAMFDRIAEDAKIQRVSVTEAPGCTATYLPDRA